MINNNTNNICFVLDKLEGDKNKLITKATNKTQYKDNNIVCHNFNLPNASVS